MGQPMWHTPPTSSVVFVVGMGRFVFTYLYLNAGNLSSIPHADVPRLEGYDDPSRSVPPGYGQSVWLEHPEDNAVAISQFPVSASSSDLHNEHGGVVHAQNPLDVTYAPSVLSFITVAFCVGCTLELKRICVLNGSGINGLKVLLFPT